MKGKLQIIIILINTIGLFILLYFVIHQKSQIKNLNLIIEKNKIENQLHELTKIQIDQLGEELKVEKALREMDKIYEDNIKDSI
ncbi:MAG: hypothetical protein JEZ09_02980 [Salinivirgaceae bacterium]|nr:hypothetical protein [Salinivirgaceae bacterium]